VVFTIPKVLRGIFRKRRRLLSLLFQSAIDTLTESFRLQLGLADGKLGAVAAVHTFGDYLIFHPHLHVLVADGLFAPDGRFHCLPQGAITTPNAISRSSKLPTSSLPPFSICRPRDSKRCATTAFIPTRFGANPLFPLSERLFSVFSAIGEKQIPSIHSLFLAFICGVLVHASKPRVLYEMFPKSIEVQMMSEQAGDFWCIGENIEVPDMEKRRPRKEGQAFGGTKEDARRIINLTDGSEKPLGEWNTMEIECKGDEIIVHVNGALVNHGSKATVTKGQIALQAEKVNVHLSGSNHFDLLKYLII
jgi:hypothetical protein